MESDLPTFINYLYSSMEKLLDQQAIYSKIQASYSLCNMKRVNTTTWIGKDCNENLMLFCYLI